VVGNLKGLKMYAELERKCRTCNKIKDIKEFYRMSIGKKTTQPDCTKCRSDKEFARGLMRFYGMTVEQYEAILLEQDNKCACCGRHKSEFKRRLHVDHNHKTGEIRGLLCTLCNPLIGYAKEDPKHLQQAVDYIVKFKK
jgi:Recombination endonuclease VII